MGIAIGIDAGTGQATGSGSTQDIISSTDIQTFGLGDQALKNAVGKYFGQNPDDAYLCSPTPWNDLYSTYSWPQVQVVLSVQQVQVVGITSNPTIVSTHRLVNDSSVKGTFQAAASMAVANTVTSTWNATVSVTLSQKLTYKVEFLGTGGGGETSLSFTGGYGWGGSQSEQVTVGSTQGVSVTLDPHQAVDVEITASRGVMKVRVTYLVSLTGDTAINYSHPYQGHHFYGLPINSVMSGGGLVQSFTTTQDLEIGFYSNDVVRLVDPSSREALMSVPGAAKTRGPATLDISRR